MQQLKDINNENSMERGNINKKHTISSSSSSNTKKKRRNGEDSFNYGNQMNTFSSSSSSSLNLPIQDNSYTYGSQPPTMNAGTLNDGVFFPWNPHPSLPHNPCYVDAVPKLDMIDRRWQEQSPDTPSWKRQLPENLKHELANYTENFVTKEVTKDLPYESESLYDLDDNSKVIKYEIDKQKYYILQSFNKNEAQMQNYFCMDVCDSNPKAADDAAHKLLAYQKLLTYSRRMYLNFPMVATKSNPCRPSDLQTQKNCNNVSEPHPTAAAIMKCIHIIFGLLETPELLFWGILPGEPDTTIISKEEPVREVADPEPLNLIRRKKKPSTLDQQKKHNVNLTDNDDCVVEEEIDLNHKTIIDGKEVDLNADITLKPTDLEANNGTVYTEQSNENAADEVLPIAESHYATRNIKPPAKAFKPIRFDPYKNFISFEEPSATKASFRCPTQTMLSRKTTYITFPRFMVHMVHIPFKNTSKDSEGKTHFPSHENVESILIVVTILDPTLNFVKGIERVIEKNNRQLQEYGEVANKKKKTQGNKEVKQAATMALFSTDEFMNLTMDPACENGFEKLYSLKDWFEILATQCGNLSELLSFMDLSSVSLKSLFEIGGVLDPCVFLAPETLYNYDERDENRGGLQLTTPMLLETGHFLQTIHYKYATVCESFRNFTAKRLRNDIEFLLDPQVSPTDQVLKVRIKINGSEEGLCPNSVMNGPQTESKIFVFKVPECVFAIPHNNISPKDFMLMRFPSRINTSSGVETYVSFVNDKHPSDRLPFPQITQAQTALLLSTMKTMKMEILMGFLFGSVRSLITDKIRYDRFKCEIYRVQDTLEPKALPKDGRVYTLRNEIFTMLSLSMVSTNPELPKTVCDVLKKMEEDNAIRAKHKEQSVSIIPDIYETYTEEEEEEYRICFEVFEDCTPTGIFDINMVSNLIHNGTAAYFVHKILYSILINQSRQFQQNFGSQYVEIIWAITSAGKTFVLDWAKRLMGGETVVKSQDSISPKAMLTSTQYTTQLLTCDDAPQSAPFFYFVPPKQQQQTGLTERHVRIPAHVREQFPEQEGSQQIKTMATSGYFTHYRNAALPDTMGNAIDRRTMEVWVDARYSRIILTNVHPVNIISTMQTRAKVVRMRDLTKLVDKYIASQTSQAVKLEVISVAYTRFCLYSGQYIRSGALFYYGEFNKIIALSFFERFKDIAKLKIGIEIDTKTRVSNELFFKTAEACMFQRVFVLCCSGAFTKFSKELSYLQPNTPFNPKMFSQLSQIGAFLLTEEDAIRAFSLLEDTFQPFAFVNTLGYIIKELRKRKLFSEYHIQKGPANWNIDAFAKLHNATSDDYKSTKQLSNSILFNIEFGYLDISDLFSASGFLNEKEWKYYAYVLEKMSVLIHNLDVVVDFNEIADILEKWTLQEFECAHYVSQKVTEKFIEYTEEGVQIELIREKIIPQATGSTVRNKILKIDLQKKKVLINRGFIEHHLNLPHGIFNEEATGTALSQTDDKFASSLVESILSQYSYVGCRHRKIILPGCALDKRADFFSIENCHPKILKYIKLCPPNSKLTPVPPADSTLHEISLDHFILSRANGKAHYLVALSDNTDYRLTEKPENWLVLSDVDTYNYQNLMREMGLKRTELTKNLTEEDIKEYTKKFSPAALDFHVAEKIKQKKKYEYPFHILTENIIFKSKGEKLSGLGKGVTISYKNGKIHRDDLTDLSQDFPIFAP